VADEASSSNDNVSLISDLCSEAMCSDAQFFIRFYAFTEHFRCFKNKV
jgi:hypothetical protein